MVHVKAKYLSILTLQGSKELVNKANKLLGINYTNATADISLVSRGQANLHVSRLSMFQL